MQSIQLPATVPEAVSRRAFLAGCAVCAARLACPAAAAAPPVQETGEKAKIRLVFSHTPPDRPTWPNIGYNYEGRKQELTTKLRQSCPDMEFLPVTVVKPGEDKAILEKDAEVDGYVWYMVGMGQRPGMTIAEAGRPVIFVDDPYAGTGTFLSSLAPAKAKGWKVAGVSSTRFDDVVTAVRAFAAMKKLRASTLLLVRDRDTGPDGKAIQDVFGASVPRVGSAEINDAYRAADRQEGQKWANLWIKNAKKIVEPTHEEIGKSGVMYIAMQNLMKTSKAEGITIDCLGLYYGGKLPAYPCLGFTQLNNDGLVGGCEGDLQSAISMLAMTYLVGRPGYISDPVIDTSKNQIIYAHCVAPTKVYGPKGPSNPYHIRNHSEDRKGAVVRSLLPLGETVTTLKINPVSKDIIFHQGKTVANIDEDKACRTKLAVEVKDAAKLMNEWSHGWHRVTFYGDHKLAVETFAGLTGLKVIMEG